jgi:hypothetical protein
VSFTQSEGLVSEVKRRGFISFHNSFFLFTFSIFFK